MSNRYFWCVLDWFLVTWYYNVQQFLSQSPTHIIIPNHSEIIGKSTLVWRHLVGCLCDKCPVAGESESPMKKAMYRKTGKSGILIVHLTGVCSWACAVFAGAREAGSLPMQETLLWLVFLSDRDKKLSFRSVTELEFV